MPQTVIDQSLAEISVKLFWLSVSDKYSPEEREELYNLGVWYRNFWRHHAEDVFETDAPALLEVNAKLLQANTQIMDSIVQVNSYLAIIDKVMSLAGALQNLVGAVDGLA